MQKKTGDDKLLGFSKFSEIELEDVTIVDLLESDVIKKWFNSQSKYV